MFSRWDRVIFVASRHIISFMRRTLRETALEKRDEKLDNLLKRYADNYSEWCSKQQRCKRITQRSLFVVKDAI